MTYKTLTEIESLVRAFEDCTLPRSHWTHQAHLTVALWYLTHFSEEVASQHLRDRICKSNAASGIENTRTSGDRETITLFWIRIIFKHLIFEIYDDRLVDIANNLLNIYKNSALIFEYYSRDLILSYETRITELKLMKHLYYD